MNRLFLTTAIIIVCFSYLNTLSAQNTADINQMLHMAVAEGNVQQVQQVLSNGADINSQNQLGWTPLHAAMNFRQDSIVQLLIERGANVNAKDNSGKTPLQLAVETNQFEAVRFLVQNGADINITNNNGDNAFSIAQKIGLRNTVNFLQQSGATMPSPTNQTQPGNRRGMNPGNNNEQPAASVNNNMNINSVRPNTSVNIALPADVNEVKAKLQAYEGLDAEILKVADGSRASERYWTESEEDNRDRLLSVARRQFEDELELIIKIAEEEQAQKTSEAADKIMSTRRDRLRIINRELSNYMDQQNRTNSRTSSSRTSRTSSRTRTSTAQQTNTTQEQESRYDAETQGEIDKWLNANVTNANGRADLLSYLNNQMLSEISSVKVIAAEENAQKTVVVIDSLLIARQNRYNELRTNLLGENASRGTTTIVQPIQPMIDPMVDPMYQGQGQFNNGMDPMYNNPRGGQPNMNPQRGNMNRRGMR